MLEGITKKNVLFLPTCTDLPLPNDSLKDLIDKTKDWALMHGAALRSKSDFNSDILQVAPFVLFPSTIRTEEFNKLANIQVVFNELIHKVAYSSDFLRNCLRNTIKVDEFTAKMFGIYQAVESEGVAQPISLGILRCDWMQHENVATNWKQVEINTIAAGFGWLGPVSREIHGFVLKEIDQHDKIKHLPHNVALSGLCDGILTAWKLYGNQDAVILFVIEDVPYNICDQRFHEFEIRKMYNKVRVIRKTLTEIGLRAFLTKEKKLVIDDVEVAVIYFRAGYDPVHYPGEKEWDARLLMEKSQAIKCPTIHYHLAGTKKVQQELTKPGALEMFFDRSKVEMLREFFVGVHGLDFDELGEEVIQQALKEPHRFVLKPQREGGGNCIYGDDIKGTLLKMKDSIERTSWILMDKIQPPITRGYIVRPGDTVPPPLSETVSELGIFGVIIADGNNVITNKQTGHMLRSKLATANEGGVASGQGALDSPFLID